MDEAKLLRGEVDSTFRGNPWHGPNVVQALEGVDAQQAKARPLPGRHSVWELVDHMACWVRYARRMSLGENPPAPGKLEDWPDAGETEEQWRGSVAELEREVTLFTGLLEEFPPERFEATVPGSPCNFRSMLHGVVYHNVYHSAQISILKRKS